MGSRRGCLAGGIAPVVMMERSGGGSRVGWLMLGNSAEVSNGADEAGQVTTEPVRERRGKNARANG